MRSIADIAAARLAEQLEKTMYGQRAVYLSLLNLLSKLKIDSATEAIEAIEDTLYDMHVYGGIRSQIAKLPCKACPTKKCRNCPNA